MKNVSALLCVVLLTTAGLARPSLSVTYPPVAFDGVRSEVLLAAEKGTLPPYLLQGEDTLFVEQTPEGGKCTPYLYSARPLTLEGYTLRPTNRPVVIPLWWSIAPPLLAILCALLFKEVLTALLSGLLLGTAIMGAYADGARGVLEGFFHIVDTYLLGALNDSGHLSVLVFSMVIGGIVALITKNGGMQGVVNRMVRFAHTTRRAQWATWLLGIAIFFDDYANTLVVGNTMRPITDKLHISRAKLAYIVDSTAAPVSAIAFVTTWIGAELGYIQQGVNSINAGGTVIAEGVYAIFLHSLAYSFYPLLTLFFIFYLIYSRRDYGPMFAVEYKARRAAHRPEQQVKPKGEELETLAPVAGVAHRAYNAVVPIALIVLGTLLGLIITGFASLSTSMAAEYPEVASSSWRTVWNNMERVNSDVDTVGKRLGMLIGAADSYTALLWASFAALVAATALTVGQGIMGLKAAVDTVVAGFKTVIPALLILVLAWALALVIDQMHTADFLTQFLHRIHIPYWTIPAITFVLSGGVAFSTGSSWSTMALVYPLILPASWALCQEPTAAVSDAAAMAIFYNTVSAVLAGSVLGDHCSPLSDTTILSSIASDCHHMQHVKTQIPYALTVGTVALTVGTLPSALGMPPLLGFALGAISLVAIVRRWGKRVERTTKTPSD